VGEAGEEAANEAPSMTPEDAELSDAPAEERSTDRQVVPPEYRDVFDRLNKSPEPQQ
jgi:hypothetical protein